MSAAAGSSSVFPDLEALSGAKRQPVPACGGVQEPGEGLESGTGNRVRAEERHHER